MQAISNLKTSGFVAVPYPADLRSAVNETVDLWKQFCALPVDVKRGLPYGDSSGGIGYQHKDGKGPKGDRKERFDATLRGTERFKVHVTHARNDVAWKFIESTTSLIDILKPVVLDFAQQAEVAFGMEGLRDEIAYGEDAFFVRFIHYFGDRKIGEETATAHPDQSGLTPHLYESASGLQCLTYDGKWVDMPVSEGEMVIIPGMQMQVRSKGVLRALCHRVVATPETVDAGRYSAVCFIHFAKTPKFDGATHGRLQEKTPGFNYSMFHGEFAKLFK
jgi:isopenicillin N synthase-like dioxygenase